MLRIRVPLAWKFKVAPAPNANLHKHALDKCGHNAGNPACWYCNAGEAFSIARIGDLPKQCVRVSVSTPNWVNAKFHSTLWWILEFRFEAVDGFEQSLPEASIDRCNARLFDTPRRCTRSEFHNISVYNTRNTSVVDVYGLVNYRVQSLVFELMKGFYYRMPRWSCS
jgi:hypothetical protein